MAKVIMTHHADRPTVEVRVVRDDAAGALLSKVLLVKATRSTKATKVTKAAGAMTTKTTTFSQNLSILTHSCASDFLL